MPQSRLSAYRRKRHANRTPEPPGHVEPGAVGTWRFVVQKHAARRLHYDFRLEWDGVLKSWAVPKGPSLDPAVKRLAVHVEDHPLDYAYFEGMIPPDNYGAGNVIVWDMGTWTALEDPAEGLVRGKLLFTLQGYKMRGLWHLFRTGQGDKDWLLVKKADAVARAGNTAWEETSVLTGREVSQVGEDAAQRWAAALAAAHAKPWAEHGLPQPMLATTADKPFSRTGWLFELKYDGFRLMGRREGTDTQLLYRRGAHASALYPELVQALGAWPVRRVLLDGELVAHDAAGLPSFQLLQSRALLSDPQQILQASVHAPVTLYVFDLLMLEGYDVRPLPLSVRKELLARLVPRLGAVRYTDHVLMQGEAMYAQVERMGLEGIMAKKCDAPYRAGRTDLWLKMPVHRRDTFCVVGMSAPQGSRQGFGALILARQDQGAWVFAGAVGSGFDDATLQRLHARLLPLAQAQAACSGVPGELHHVTWLAPTVMCWVRYKEITAEGSVRQAVFEGLQEAAPKTVALGPASPGPQQQVSVTNPAKLFWPEEGYTKGDLLAYYRAIAPWLLPYLRDRPLTLTRFPDGIHGKSFFQKDAPQWTPSWVRRVRMTSESSERDIDYFVIDDVESLLYVINMGTIPLHIGASRVTQLGQPDWCILDLDPKTAPFVHVVQVARAVYALCKKVGLPAFVKTSGSTGLHVFIPLQGVLSYEPCRALAEILARLVVQNLPDIATIERNIQARGGRVYIDTGQNGHGKLLAAPFSARPVPGALVSMPLRWRAVRADLNFRRFHIKSAPELLVQGDPFAGVLSTPVDLRGALPKLEALL